MRRVPAMLQIWNIGKACTQGSTLSTRTRIGECISEMRARVVSSRRAEMTSIFNGNVDEKDRGSLAGIQAPTVGL